VDVQLRTPTPPAAALPEAPWRVGSALKGVYRSIEYSQRELERIYWLKIRLTSRLLMKSVKEERD
ncbi:hypothetical protein PtrEW7m1_011358, partial [Pyrenophora tritici-repentis]